MTKRFGLSTSFPLPVILVLFVMGPAEAIAAEAKKPPAKNVPPAVEPPAPFIDFVYPAGGQRGKTIQTTVSGANLDGANAVRLTGDGVDVSIAEVLSTSAVRLSVAIAPDAELGERDLRVTTPGGVSNRFRFFVGELPEVNEVEPNSEPGQAQRLESLPILVNGQIFEADKDYYRFTAKAGQTLVCAVDARTILPYMADAVPGWLDACLTLYDAGGKQLAYCDDFRFKPDPVLIYNVPKDGEYLLEIKDILYRGRGNFVYRLKIGTLPCITHIFPLGGQRGTTTDVELRGVNLSEKTMKLDIPADSPPLRQVQVTSGGLTSNAVPFAVANLREVREVEPNDSPEQAMRVEAPVVINGRIEKPGDVDYFLFHAEAKQQLLMEVRARRLDSPLDSLLTLLNAKGQELAENDDTPDPSAALVTHQADSRLIYTFPAAGDYLLRVADVQGNGGDEYAYRLLIAPPQPDFALRITPDNLRVGQGETTAVAVYALRDAGFNGEISLAVQDLPPGFTASEAVIPPGMDQARLTITAPADVPISVCAPSIVGTAKLDKDAKEAVVRKAVPSEAMMQSFSLQQMVPTKEFSLAVVEPSSFNVFLSEPPPGQVLEVKQGTDVLLKLKVVRKEGVKIGLSLAMEGRAQGITAKSAYLGPDQEEATVTLTVAPAAPVGLTQSIILGASYKGAIKQQSITRVAPAIPVKVIPSEPPKK